MYNINDKNTIFQQVLIIYFMKILLLGDTTGKSGREALKEHLPKIKKQYKPDIIIVNGENLAHGNGITTKIMEEILGYGIDFITSGNHIWDKKDIYEIFSDKKLKDKIIRPENYPPGVPGEGYKILNINTHTLLIINLIGRVFMPEDYDCPFRALDDILNKVKNKKIDGVIVDFHAEATSEKEAFGWYADGRVSAVLGTHTHVQTADEKILPKGTAYITDIGMIGSANSVIGAAKENILKTFLTQIHRPIEVDEEGPVIINGALIKINYETKLAEHIERINITQK